MAIGGFNGSDPSPTLAQFQAATSPTGEIHYFIAGGGGRSVASAAWRRRRQGRRAGRRVEIATWVAATFTAQTVDGVTLYDLSTGVDRPSGRAGQAWAASLPPSAGQASRRASAPAAASRVTPPGSATQAQHQLLGHRRPAAHDQPGGRGVGDDLALRRPRGRPGR